MAHQQAETSGRKEHEIDLEEPVGPGVGAGVAGGFARALLRAQGQIVSSLGLHASGVLHLPRGIPTKQFVKGLDNLTSAYDMASTVREHKHEEHRTVWGSVKAEYRARGLYGIGRRFLAPLGRSSVLGTVLFASYESLLTKLDEPPDEDSDQLQLYVRRETAPLIAGLGAGLLHGAASAVMAAMPGQHGKAWTIRQFARRLAARAPLEMARDALEMGTVFGTYEMTKRGLMLLSSDGAHPTEVVAVGDLPVPPPTEGLIANMPAGAGAAVHEPGEAGPHEARVGSQKAAPYHTLPAASPLEAPGRSFRSIADRDQTHRALRAVNDACALTPSVHLQPSACAPPQEGDDPEVWFAPEVVAAVLSAGAITGCVQVRLSSQRSRACRRCSWPDQSSLCRNLTPT